VAAPADSLNTRPLGQGQSVAELSLIDEAPDLSGIPARSLEAPELEQILTAYNDQIKNGLTNAPKDSPLGQFASSLKLMANLQDPRLQQDKQAWELLKLRQTQIESRFTEQSQLPEVKQFFEQTRAQALTTVLDDPAQRAKQQAAWLMSETYQISLSVLPPAERQAQMQEALSGLTMLDPDLASQVSGKLSDQELTLQALEGLQSQGPDGESARNGLGKALQVYLKAQQSSVRLGVAANQFSRLMALPDDRLDEISQAVSGLAAKTQATSPRQLMTALLDHIDELPGDLRGDATTLLQSLSDEKYLGTLVLAGSMAGLMRQELPNDPKTWLVLTSGSLSTAGSAHHGLRLLGLHAAADFAGKINYQLPVGAFKIPVLGTVTSGLGLATELIGLSQEVANEDHVGTGAKLAGVGSSLAGLAAITIMSGPAAPLTLVGATVVGVGAWGINSLWGESDLTGELRQQLRNSGITPQEEQLLQSIGSDQLAPTVPERVALINGLLDRGADDQEDARIARQLLGSNDVDFKAQIQALHLPRLIGELDDADMAAVLSRAFSQTPDAAAQTQLAETALKSLLDKNRLASIQQVLPTLPAGSLSRMDPELYQKLLDTAAQGNIQDAGRYELLTSLLTHPDLSLYRQALPQQDLQIQQWRSTMGPDQSAPLLRQLMTSPEPAQQALAQKWLSPPPASVFEYLSPMDQNPMGQDMLQRHAARLVLITLEGLSPEQIEQLPPGLKAHMTEQLSFMQPRFDAEQQSLDKMKSLLA
jgi:hypothetical protein